MQTTRLLTVAVLALALLLALAPAAPSPFPEDATSGTYAVDGGHSTAWFGVLHLGVANFYGRFNTISGEFVLDTEDVTQSSVKIQIDPMSVDTQSSGRDEHIRSADFLDVENFPLMGFQSTGVEAGEDGSLRVTGHLTLHGERRELAFDAVIVGAGDSPWGDHRCGLEARFTVKRSEFGMEAMLDKLGDEVHFTVSLEGILQKG